MSTRQSTGPASPEPTVPKENLPGGFVSWLRKLRFDHPAPQRLRWTPALVERFWTGFSETRLVECGFARQGGKGFVSAVSHLLPKNGRILDFGAGDGEIAEMLCQRDLQVAVYEPSIGRSRSLRDRLGKYPEFLGTVDMRSKQKFDVVMMVEVIEHVLDEQLHSTLSKLAHFTCVGGTLIISTPNNEDLDLSMCYCPVSNLLFHRWQHVRSFTRSTLVALMAKYGFEEIVTHELEFNNNLYVPYDEACGSSSGSSPLPSHVVAIRANRPVSIGAQNSLLYVGRRLSWREAVDKQYGIKEKTVEIKSAVNILPKKMHDVLKLIFKRLFGRHYEPWLRRPYVSVVKPVMRRLVKAARNPRVILPAVSRRMAPAGRRLRSLLVVRPSTIYRRVLERAAIRAQLQLQTLSVMSPVHPLRILLTPVFRLPVVISGHRYRRSFRRLGDALKTRAGAIHIFHEGVLLMIGTLGPGGAERQAVYTLLGMTRRGIFPVALAAVDLRGATQRFHQPKLQAAGIPAFELDRDKSHDTSEPLVQVLEALRLLPPELADVGDYARTLAKQRPRLVHLWLDEVNIKGGLAAVALGVPRIVLGARSLPPCHFLLYQPYMREGYRWLAQQPQVTIVCNSEAGARAYEHWLELPHGHIRVIHNGFDMDEKLLAEHRNRRDAYRGSHGIPEGAQVVGTVIRLSEEKRPLLFAEIAAHALQHTPETHFLVVGDGPLREQLEARATEPDIAGRLHIVGHEQKPFDAIASMDIFLLTSRAEGLPNVLIEAQALGVPVVTTRVGGAPETLVEGRTGWVLSDDHPESAAAQVVQLLGNKGTLKQAGGDAREHVRQHFTLDRMIEETLQVYEIDTRYIDHRAAICGKGEV